MSLKKRGRIAAIGATLVILLACGTAAWWFGIESPRRRTNERIAKLTETEGTADGQRRREEAETQAAAEKKSFEDKVNAAAAARLAEEKRKSEEVAVAEAKKKEGPARNIANASKEQPWENSLGMRFVPVAGTTVLFSIWQTRVRDYEVFVKETGRSFEKAPFVQTPLDPVANVSWDDGKAFCAWLTARERTFGRITQQHEYRLPTDAEWSAAVGKSKYPWGNAWPPPKNFANYGTPLAVDEYTFTSPVGAFPPNAAGLHDMGGNLWQWCENWYRKEMNDAAVLARYPELKDDGLGRTQHVVRGASWFVSQPIYMLSSTRVSGGSPTYRNSNNGFRCVLSNSPLPPAQLPGSK
ncbi:MAG TPA: SUMF1/EgtB/PvdO family nonheme iron enzyme [Chthoniobacterales bacterium]